MGAANIVLNAAQKSAGATRVRGENSVGGLVGSWGGNLVVAGDSQAWFAREDLTADQLIAGSVSTVSHINGLMGGAFLVQAVTARSGVDTNDVLDRQLPMIIALKQAGLCDTVYLEITSNDFYSTTYSTEGAPRTAEYVKANILQILRTLSLYGVRCIYSNGFPRGPATVGTNTYGAVREAQQTAYITWTQAVLPTLFPQHVIVDAYSLGKSGGSIITGYLYDDLHHASAYAYAIAKQAVAQIYQVNPALYPRILSTAEHQLTGGASRSACIFGYSALGGNVGDTSIPSPWVETLTSATATYRVVANPWGGAGNAVEATITFSAAAGLWALAITENGLTAGGRIGPTDSFCATALVSTVGMSAAVKDIYCRASVSAGTPKYAFGPYRRSADTAGLAFGEDLSGYTLMSAIKQAVSGVTSVGFQIAVRSLGAGTIKITFAEPAVWKIPLGITDTTATPGAATVNGKRARVAIASGATAMTLTDALINAGSTVVAALVGSDTNITALTVSPGAGSATITGNATASAAQAVEVVVLN